MFDFFTLFFVFIFVKTEKFQFLFFSFFCIFRFFSFSSFQFFVDFPLSQSLISMYLFHFSWIWHIHYIFSMTFCFFYSFFFALKCLTCLKKNKILDGNDWRISCWQNIGRRFIWKGNWIDWWHSGLEIYFFCSFFFLFFFAFFLIFKRFLNVTCEPVESNETAFSIVLIF